MRPVVGGGRGQRRAITGQLQSVDIHKKETYKKFCQERPSQLYNAQERPAKADKIRRRRRRRQGQPDEQHRLSAKSIPVYK
jgi:hypothetical protein